MEMKPVNSSQIATIGYDPETLTAVVSFVRGGLYRYEQVEDGVVDAIINSDSPGRQFAATLKSGYQYERIG